jgi:hypothetical protein
MRDLKFARKRAKSTIERLLFMRKIVEVEGAYHEHVRSDLRRSSARVPRIHKLLATPTADNVRVSVNGKKSGFRSEE